MSLNNRKLNLQLCDCATPRSLEVLILRTSSTKFNEINCATALYRLAKMHSQNVECIQKIILICEETLKTFEAQSISNMVWAFATLDFKDEVFLEKIAKEVCQRDLEKFNTQNIANTVWAFATLDFKDEVFLEKIAKEVCQRDLEKFNSQEISNTIWAFATLDFKDEVFLEKIAKEVCQREWREFTVQNIANTVWAFGTLGFFHSQLFQKEAFPFTLNNKDQQQLMKTKSMWQRRFPLQQSLLLNSLIPEKPKSTLRVEAAVFTPRVPIW